MVGGEGGGAEAEAEFLASEAAEVGEAAEEPSAKPKNRRRRQGQYRGLGETKRKKRPAEEAAKAAKAAKAAQAAQGAQDREPAQAAQAAQAAQDGMASIKEGFHKKQKAGAEPPMSDSDYLDYAAWQPGRDDSD